MQTLISEFAAVRGMAPITGTCAVMGIDMSLTACAVTIAKPGMPVYTTVFKSKPAKGPRARVMRYRSIAVPLTELAIQCQPSLVLIEGVAHTAMMRRGPTGEVLPVPQQGHMDRAELRGVILDRLADHCEIIVEPNPGTLKQYQGGKITMRKVAAVSAYSARIGRAFKTDDECDSYALTMLGVCALGLSSAETQPQHTAVTAVVALMRGAA